MIVSVHLADVGRRSGPSLLRTRLRAPGVPGLRYAEVVTAAPLGSHLLPRPDFARVGLVAAWDDDAAVEEFVSGHPFARRIAHGWCLRLKPMRLVGAWRRLDGLLTREQPMDEDEPAAVLTLGRLRISQTIRFLRASAAAEGLAVRNPALIASTGLARPPLVATFSLWRTKEDMRAYAMGRSSPEHLAAIRAHASRPFHHEAAFIRFRPYAGNGIWNGCDLEQVVRSEPPRVTRV